MTMTAKKRYPLTHAKNMNTKFIYILVIICNFRPRVCPHIFFRLSLSSFLINTLITNYLTSFSLTILTLCVIIFLKTVIIFIFIIFALNFH